MSEATIGEREEIEMLLPWYVTGRLEPGEMAKVEAYLAAHPELARRVHLVRAEREETVAVNDALGAPSAAATERIMAALPAARPATAARRALGRLWELAEALFVAPTPAAVRWAAVAVAALVAVETVALVTLISAPGERGGTYQTAAGVETANGIAALVVFADGASAPAISQLLTQFDARIVDGPRAGGLYKIRLRTEDRSPAARDAVLRRLAERRDVVRSVVPSRD
jgi:anti-sigma factor RsiW